MIEASQTDAHVIYDVGSKNKTRIGKVSIILGLINVSSLTIISKIL